MKIKRLILKNWKNFTDVDVGLASRSFIVGPNASGKSNLLDSLRFLHDISRPGRGLAKALSDRGGLKKIRSLSARKEPQVEIKIELEEADKTKSTTWTYHLSLINEVRGTHRTLIEKERVTKDGEILLNRPDKDDESDSLRLTQTSLEQINVNSAFRELYTFFQDIGYIHLIPQIIRQPELFFNTNIKIDDDSYGFHFLESIVNASPQKKRSRLKKIEQALKIAVPQLTDLRESRDEKGVPHLEATYEHWRPNAGKQQEREFSDGTIRLIGLLWSILEGKSVILLEEPELSLHPAIVRKIPQIIHNITRGKGNNIQIMLSTHSPDLLSDGSISAKEIILLDAAKEGTRVRTAHDIDDVRTLLESGLSPEEVVIPFSSPKDAEQLSLFK
ncbi:MAG: AAA family ATPase [Spirochaetia bacterium]|nr:AAA family ATPase [Spirochaetia bacterium]